MRTKKILISGNISLSPIGRHSISFLSALLVHPQCEVYFDSFYCYDDSTLKEFFSNELKSKALKASSELPFDYPYDFLVYTDSLSTTIDDHWCLSAISRCAKIKACYPVFDGSIPPLNWIDLINSNFDICLTPSAYCAHNLRRYGITIDCFALNCAILLEELLSIEGKGFILDRPFRFGSIGASDFRKNIPLLIRSFIQAFGNNKGVELYIHTSYGKDLSVNHEIKNAIELASGFENIIIQSKKISHSEMVNLWKSFDVYVSPQTTTGYFTTPAEALALGIPVILSDIAVHKNLSLFFKNPQDSLFFVKHDILEPAFHWCLDYRNLGVKFNCSESEYAKEMLKVYELRKSLYSNDLVRQRKNIANQFTSLALSSQYHTLIFPQKICINKRSSGIKKNVFYMSEGLSKKYNCATNVETACRDIELDPFLYPEEELTEFKILEKVAIEEQKIYNIKHFWYQSSFASEKFTDCEKRIISSLFAHQTLRNILRRLFKIPDGEPADVFKKYFSTHPVKKIMIFLTSIIFEASLTLTNKLGGSK